MTAECVGTGGPPAEMVLLDDVPGMEPSGTCPVCGKSMTLRRYRIPAHTGVETQ